MPEPTKQQLLEWDCHHYWHSFTQMQGYESLVIEEARGAILIDINGREYLDGVSSLWCNVHGHRHPEIDEAIRQQLDKVAHCTSLGASHPAAIRLARRLAEMLPADLEHVFFSSDGASSVEVALKMAFQYWQQCETPDPKRTKFLALGEAYHGDTIGGVTVGGLARFRDVFEPLLFEVVRTPSPDPRKLPDDVPREAATSYYLDHLDRALTEHAGEVAAMILEPLVQGAAGMLMQPAGYLRGVRDLCSAHDVLLICDEVATGFGRTGKMFACEHEDIVPDILCLGKGITGGYLPLAATIATSQIWQAFLGDHAQLNFLSHGHTFSGNPLAAAAALASLDLFDKEETLRELQPKIARLGVHLSRLAKHPHVADARQTGFIGAIELVKDKETGEPYLWQDRTGWKICHDILDRGVWMRPLGDVLVIMPPFCVTVDQIDRIMEAVANGIDAVAGGS